MRHPWLALIVAIAAPALASAQDRPVTTVLGLRDAIGAALRSSPDLQPSEDAVLSAHLQQRQAAAPFDVRWSPLLTTGSNPGGYNSRVLGFTASKQLVSGGNVWATASSSSYGGTGLSYQDNGYTVGFSQPIATLLSPVATQALTTAKRAVTSSQRQLEETRQQLVISTAELYFAVVRGVRLVEAGEHARDRAARLVQASKARAAAGLDTELDVMRAELLLSQDESGLADHREALAVARERLNLAIGRPLDIDYDVSMDEAEWTEPAPALDTDPVAAALGHRLTVQEAHARVDDAKRAMTVARWNQLPPLNLNVEYDQHGLGSPLQGIFAPMNGWHVSLSSSYAIDRTAPSIAAASAAIAVRAAEREAQDTERRITADVRRASRAVTRADLAADLQRQSLDVAERQLRLAHLRYERGLTDNFTVIDAENTLFQIQSASISADIERWLSRAHLERAAGTLDVRRFTR